MLRQQLQNIQHQSALHVICKSKQQKPIHLPFPGIESRIRAFKQQYQISSSISDTQLQDVHGKNDGGIYPGDSLTLYGKTGAGKTYILSRILNDTINKQLDVVYIDLGHHYGSTTAGSAASTTTAAMAAIMNGGGIFNDNQQQQHQHIHLFRPRTDSDLLGLIHSLEKWFYDHGGDNNKNVEWVMIDGEWNFGGDGKHDLKQQLVEKLKSLQYHWPFALMTTYQDNNVMAANSLQQQVVHNGGGQEYRFECYKQDKAICMKLVPPSSSNHAYSVVAVDDLKFMVTIVD